MVKKVLIEIASVVFAVLLALGLNHWREASNDQKLADQALLQIVNEVRENIQSVEQGIEEYKAELDTLEKLKTRMAQDASVRISMGYSHPILNNAAWNMANSTGAVKDMDYNVLMGLSELYIYQEMYLDNGFSYFKEVTKPRPDNYEWDKAFLNSLIAQIKISISFGAGLRQGYIDFLDEYKDQLPEASN